jgi:hypothetical protein
VAGGICCKMSEQKAQTYANAIYRQLTRSSKIDVVMRAAKIAVTVFVLVAVCPAILEHLLAESAMGQDGGQDVRPTLRLEKPKYVLGESIRFWVGVEPMNPKAPIPEELRKPCHLKVTSPESGEHEDSIGWPGDGDFSRGFSGGWGIKAATAGSYGLEMECNGHRTTAVTLVVEANPVAALHVDFDFGKAGEVDAGERIPVTLRVKNDTPYELRFPRPGQMMEGISLEVLREEPKASVATFYPWRILCHGECKMPRDTYTWEIADIVPSVVLKPGESFELPLVLQDAYRFDGQGNYKVTFSTALAVLVGDRNGEFRDISPVRVIGRSVQEFEVRRANP